MFGRAIPSTRFAIALVALPSLAALGTFLIYGLGIGPPSLSLPSVGSPFMLAGEFCLLGAAYSGTLLLKVGNRGSWKKLPIVTSLGIVIMVLAPFIPFPVSCNLQTWFSPHPNISSGCPANPMGSWSTIWPNVFLLEAGILFASIGLASAKPERSLLVGAGLGLMMGGFALIAFGSSFTYMTMCPEGGCPPLTSAQWWSLFWPDVTAKIIGASQVVVGAMTCSFAFLRGRQVTLSQEMATIPVSGRRSAEAQ